MTAPPARQPRDAISTLWDMHMRVRQLSATDDILSVITDDVLVSTARTLKRTSRNVQVALTASAFLAEIARYPGVVSRMIVKNYVSVLSDILWKHADHAGIIGHVLTVLVCINHSVPSEICRSDVAKHVVRLLRQPGLLLPWQSTCENLARIISVLDWAACAQAMLPDLATLAQQFLDRCVHAYPTNHVIAEHATAILGGILAARVPEKGREELLQYILFQHYGHPRICIRTVALLAKLAPGDVFFALQNAVRALSHLSKQAVFCKNILGYINALVYDIHRHPACLVHLPAIVHACVSVMRTVQQHLPDASIALMCFGILDALMLVHNVVPFLVTFDIVTMLLDAAEFHISVQLVQHSVCNMLALVTQDPTSIPAPVVSRMHVHLKKMGAFYVDSPAFILHTSRLLARFNK